MKHEKQWWQFWKRRTPGPIGGEVMPSTAGMFRDATFSQLHLRVLLMERGRTNLSGVETAIWEPFIARLAPHPHNPAEVWVRLNDGPVDKITSDSPNSSFTTVGWLGRDAAAAWCSKVSASGFIDIPVEVGMPAKGIYHDGNYRIEIRSARRPAGFVTSTRR